MMAPAHIPIKPFHEPLFAARKHRCQIMPPRHEVFCVRFMRGQALIGRPGAQLGIEPPFVGGLPFHAYGFIPLG